MWVCISIKEVAGVVVRWHVHGTMVGYAALSFGSIIGIGSRGDGCFSSVSWKQSVGEVGLIGAGCGMVCRESCSTS